MIVGLLARGGLRPCLALSKPLRASGSAGRRASSRGRPLRVNAISLLGGYQYKQRVARLQQRGVQVHDFGSRVLQEQCYGDDVVSLQRFLGEQGYLNLMDGVTGYFGSVTKEALQNWQRDQGLAITGAFNLDCKLAYLKQAEARVTEAAKPVVSVMPVAVALPPIPSPMAYVFAWQVWVGGAALAAAAFFSLSRVQLHRVGPNPLGRLARLAFNAAKAAAGATALFAAALLVGLGQLVLATLRFTWHATVASASALLAGGKATLLGARWLFARLGAWLLLLDPTPAAVTPAAPRPPRGMLPQHAEHTQQRIAIVTPAMSTDEMLEEEELLQYYAAELAQEELTARAAQHAERAAAASSTPYLEFGVGRGYEQGRASVVQQASSSRLSDEELQRRISPMKAEAQQVQRSTVQRPAPKPLEDKAANDPFLNSKYGKYYGGQKVREQLSDLLDDARGPSGPARRMQAIGYNMDTRPGATKRAKQSRSGAASASSSSGELAVPVQQSAPRRSPLPFNPPAAPRKPAAAQPGGQDRPAFSDVSNGASTSSLYSSAPPAGQLLAGTELEATPDRPARPVNVHRGSSSEAAFGMAAYGQQAQQQQQGGTVAAASRPVAVAKGPVTVGDLMKMAEEEPHGDVLGAARAASPAAAAAAPRGSALDPDTVVVRAPIPVHKPARLAAARRQPVAEPSAEWR